MKLTFLFTPACFLVFLILAPSCGKISGSDTPVFYSITNNTDSKIKVIYSPSYHMVDYAGKSNQRIDTVFIIESSDKSSLLTTIVTYPNEFDPLPGDTIPYFKMLRIYRQDTIQSSKNWRLAEYWEYSPGNGEKGEFTLNVNPGDFNH